MTLADFITSQIDELTSFEVWCATQRGERRERSVEQWQVLLAEYQEQVDDDREPVPVYADRRAS